MKRQGLSKWFTSGVLALSMLASSNPALASDIFLKIGDIKGESQDDKHKEWIEVLSWSWGQSTGTGRTAKGRQAASCIQDLHFMKQVDASSPELIKNGVVGEVAPTAVLTLTKAGGHEQQQEFLKLTMKNVTVVSFQISGSDGADLPMESVSLHFESIQGEYRKQKSDGSLEAPITWDITGGGRGCQP
jgi:type VI secretion system secreted protein Hcp